MKNFLLSTTGFAFAAVALTFLFSFTVIGQTDRGITYRLGKMQTETTADLRQPGLNFTTPFIQHITKVQVSQQQEDYDDVVTYTKDNQVITANLSVFFKVPEDHIVSIYRNNPDWSTMLQSAVYDSYKSALGSQEAQNVAQNRDVIMKQVTKETQEKVRNLLGLEITQVMMPNFDFNKEFEAAVSNAANAKAELNRKQTELEQSRVDAQKKIVEANASASANKAQADGSSYATVKNKEAEAEGFRKIAESIGQNNMSAYLYTTKWDGSVPTVSTGGGGAQIWDMRDMINNDRK